MPDVKVTLSADDQATEIVRRLSLAVKQLNAENKASAANTNASAAAATKASSSFNGMASAIASVAAAIGAVRVLNFVRDTITAADELGKLGLKTGATTEGLSVLAVAASTADLSTEELANGLKFLAKSTTDLAAGSQDAAAAFGALGLSARDLRGLSLDQVLVRIADAQAKFGDGAGKTAALLKIFGRAGEDLIPLLHDLADGGFDEAAKQAKKLGLIISQDDFKAAQAFNDSLTTLRNTAKGLALQLLPLIKGVTDLATGITNFVAAHPDFSAFGAGAFVAAAGATALAAAVGVLVFAVGALDVALAPVLGLIAALAVLGGAAAVMAAKFREAKKEAEAMGAAAKKTSATATSNLPQVVLNDPGQVKALREARLAATKQSAKDELEATQTGLKQRESLEAASFAQGLTSLSQFYAARRSITQQGIDAQIAELEKEKRALQASPLSENTDAARIKRATDIAAIEEQIKRTKVSGQTQVLELLEQERVAVKALQDELLGFSAQIAAATGNAIGAQQIAIEQAGKKLELALRAAGGVSEDQINAQRNAFVQLLTERAAFEENLRQGERAITDLGLERQRIELRAAQGQISQRDAQEQIAAIERERLPTLRAIAERMEFFAASVKDEGLIEAAKQFRAEFEGIGKVILESQLRIANLASDVRDAVKGATSNFLTDGIDSVLARDTSELDGLRSRLKFAQQELQALEKGPQTEAAQSRIGHLREQMQDLNVEIDIAKANLPTIGNALRESVLSGIKTIQRAIADILASQLVEKLDGIFGGAKTVTVAASTTTAASALGTAGGVVVAGATGITTASGALSTSGGILLTAAGALSAAAAALATAGAAQTVQSALAAVGVFTPGFASGGFVRGPGSGTSDSIPARLSAGEFIIRAAAVRRYGVDFFRLLNGARMPTLRRPTVQGLPAFATGGLVTAGDSSGASASVNGEIGLHVSADEGLLVKLLGTRGGIKALREAIGANPGKFKAALQIG